MKRYLLYMLLFLTWSLIACDDGKIYDETVIVTGEGRTLKLTGQESKAGRRNIALSLPDSETENLQLLQNRYRHRLPMVKSLK